MNDDACSDNPRAVPGDNNPPTDGMVAAANATSMLRNWLAENPVIQDHETASAGKVTLEAAKSAKAALEEERDSLVRPLNEQVKTINGEYRGPRELLEKLIGETADRIQAYILQEAAKRRREAEIARLQEEKALEKARAAEAAENEARENAAHGEFTDVGGATIEADQAFNEYAKARREANVAERDTKVRIGGGSGRALGLRTVETLVIEDPAKAVKAIMKERGGVLPDKLADAIRAAARDYRKAKGKLPDGVTSQVEQRI